MLAQLLSYMQQKSASDKCPQATELFIIIFGGNDAIGCANHCTTMRLTSIFFWIPRSFALPESAGGWYQGFFFISKYQPADSFGIIEYLFTGQDAMEALLVHYLFDIVIDQQVYFFQRSMSWFLNNIFKGKFWFSPLVIKYGFQQFFLWTKIVRYHRQVHTGLFSNITNWSAVKSFRQTVALPSPLCLLFVVFHTGIFFFWRKGKTKQMFNLNKRLINYFRKIFSPGYDIGSK